MAKTIKQIADELQIDKQKVYRFIKKNYINEAHQKSGVMYYDETVENLIKSHFSKNTTSTEVHQITSNDVVIDVLMKQSEMLKNELEIKNKQIEQLNKRLEENQKLLDQAQQLHAMTEQKVKLLEQTEDTRKSFLQKIFKERSQSKK